MKRFWISLAVTVMTLACLTACAGVGDAPSESQPPAATAAPSPEPASGELTRYEASFLDLFDTFSQMVVYCESKEEANEFAKALHDELEIYHQLYDIYNAYEGVNNLYALNERAASEPVEVDPRLMSLLLFGKEAYALTDGRVNIAMGSVLRIWHDYRDAGLADPAAAKLPPMDALTAAAKHTDINDLILDAEANTVFFADPDLKLDVGAIAKGYAVERVAEMLEAQGARHALLSIGGNVRAIGNRADGTDFRVAVQNPDLSSDQKSLVTLNMKDLSLVSSGDYQRYYTVDGKRYHHIIDPDTLMPSEYFSAVSIVTRDSGLADALSTALYNLPYEDGKALVEKISGVEALWVLHDGSLMQTDGFAALSEAKK